MKLTVFNIAMLVAFAVMLSAKVFEVGIGATLSWWIVTLPIYGPITFVLVLAGLAFVLAFFYNLIVNKK